MKCDSPLYAVNMFYYHWLIKKLFGPMTGQNRARWEFQAEIEEKRRQNQEDAMELLKETDARTLPRKPRPCGNAQSNRNG